MRVIVCGGRDFTDYEWMCRVLDLLKPDVVIEGEAPGADLLSRRWAESRGADVIAIPANWVRYGRAAGPIRNGAMLTYKPDHVHAFPGGSGTANMIEQAERAGVPVTQHVLTDRRMP